MELLNKDTNTKLSTDAPIKRFASIDFLRGLAIFIMIVLHIVADYLDVDALLAADKINTIPLINLIILAIMAFLGGLAGLFLIASAISNMVSMQRNLRNGRSVVSIALKQIVGGVILLIFAMLTEGVTGYHGMFGSFIHNLKTPTLDVFIARRTWATFETIHTIAWCTIINGIVQVLLSIKGGWRKPRRQMLIYAILSVIVIICTKFIWDGLYSSLLGSNSTGFPWGTNADGSLTNLPNHILNSITGSNTRGYPWGANADGSSMWQPDVRTAGFGAVLVGIFVNPLAAPFEPIFPYLAVSFIGSIIGIAISQPKKALFKGFTKIVLLTSFVMFVVGAVGTVFEVVNVLNNTNLNDAVTFYRHISFHRHWFPDAPQPYAPFISPFAWLWQFLFTNGFSIMLVLIVIYLVEFRGRGSQFAKRTKYIRRYGIVAFSNYNNQWLYYFPPLFIPLLFGQASYSKTLWGGTILLILTTLVIYTIVLYLWGLVNYRFSLEWFMKSINYILIPIRRNRALKEKKWWQKGDINMKGAFHDAEWINIVEQNDAYHKAKTDSKISMILSICSLAIPIFFAFSVVTLPMSIKARKSEGINKKNTTALILSIIGVIITIAFFVFAFVVTPTSLGFAF